MTRRELDRRQFLAAAGSNLLVAGLGTTLARRRSALAGPSGAQDWLLESQGMPQPRVVLPTDGIDRKGSRKRIAAITTAYYKYSHADVIITKLIEG